MFDANLDTSSPPEQGRGGDIPRLFQLDLPRLAAGKVFPEQLDLSAIRRVVDVACGTGEWVRAATLAFPQLELMGIDGSNVLLDRADTRASDRLTFAVMKNVTPPFDLPVGSVDLMNLRFVAHRYLVTHFPALVAECLRIVRPGGIILLTEGDLPITSSPACERLSNLLSEALGQTGQNLFPPIPSGRNFLIAPLLPRLLVDAGCQHITQAMYVTNFGQGTPAHADIAGEYHRICRLAQPVLLRLNVSTQPEMEQLQQGISSELQAETFRGVGFYRAVWGRKP